MPAKRKYKRQPLKEVDVSNNLLDNLFEGINDAAVDVVQSYDHNDIMENENVPTNPVTAPNPSVLLDIPIFQCDDNLQIDISCQYTINPLQSIKKCPIINKNACVTTLYIIMHDIIFLSRS